jgi:hypothetical protein
MSTQTFEQTEHIAVLPVGEGAQVCASLRLGHKNQTARQRLYLPEQELCRRLWRIYQMALSAAERDEQTGQAVPLEA